MEYFKVADKYFCSIQDLPREVLRTVLKSDRLVLLSARGNVVPGILREVRVAAIIEQYLSRHPDQSIEQFLPCLKIWDMDTFVELAGAGAGISPETVAIVQSSFAAFQTSICRHLQGEDVVTFDPRTLRITPQDSYSGQPGTDPQHFELSCRHPDQNIVRITARAQRSPGSDTAAMVSLTLALDTGELLSVETPGAAARWSTALL